MSDTAAAILILPTMAVLVLVLEGSRILCTRLVRRIRRTPKQLVSAEPVIQ